MSYQEVKAKIKGVPQDVGYLTCMFYGKPDTGKTTLAASFPKPLLLDIRERGFKSVRKVKGLKMLSISSWQELNDVYQFLRKDDHPYETVIWDTTNNAQQLAVEDTIGSVKKGKSAGDWGTVSQQQWGEIATKVKGLGLSFRDLNKEMNVVFLAHQKTFGEGEDSVGLDPHIGPALSPSVSQVLNAAVDIIGHTFIREKVKIIKDPKTGKKQEERHVDYCLRVGPSGTYITKVRNDKEKLTPDVLKDPSYDDLIELME